MGTLLDVRCDKVRFEDEVIAQSGTQLGDAPSRDTSHLGLSSHFGGIRDAFTLNTSSSLYVVVVAQAPTPDYTTEGLNDPGIQADTGRKMLNL